MANPSDETVTTVTATSAPAPASRQRSLRPLLYGLLVAMVVLLLALLAAEQGVARRVAGGERPAFPGADRPDVMHLGR